jgi:hypothetical protein
MAKNSTTQTSTSSTQGNNMPATPAKCVYCGKTLTKNASVTATCGAKCAKLASNYTPAQLVAHYATVTGTVPQGYITVASLHKTIVANKAKYPGISVAKMVKAIGGDRALQTPAHPVCTPVYNGNCRWVNGWLQTPAGLNAIATGNFGKAPTK